MSQSSSSPRSAAALALSSSRSTSSFDGSVKLMTSTKGSTTSKWTAAAALSLKQGPHKTMFLVRRDKVNNAAVSVDNYIPRGSYSGDWSQDKRSGFGTQTYENGDKYEGHWLNDKYHGHGCYYKFVPSSSGTARKPGLTKIMGNLVKVYEGEYREGKYGSTGNYTYENGDV